MRDFLPEQWFMLHRTANFPANPAVYKNNRLCLQEYSMDIM